MDSFGLEKANAVFCCYQKRKAIAALFRLVEMIILFLLAVSIFSNQIPATFSVSGEYFRRFLGTILCPKIVFVVGNVIVIVLFLKSGFISNSDSNGTDLYDKNERFKFNDEQSKQSIFEVKMTVNMTNTDDKERKIQREKLITKRDGNGEKTLFVRPSDDDSRRKVKYPEDEMSNEEFRRTVEAFIARQQRFLRE